ncbi:MAG: TlyA family RNA methyltransferase [Myxococcota bacterium]
MSQRGPKARADVLLHERGLAESRAKAQALILAGVVYRGPGFEIRVEKAGDRLFRDEPLQVRGDRSPYVSRGGLKLEGALDAFGIDPTGWVLADFGASTGGFTDCLLQRGAERVYAIDVGYGQLHQKLRNDERVVVMERTNARHLRALPEPVDGIVVDASFIGLGKLLPAAAALLRPGGEVLAMVKPQFEVGAARVGKGGVVRDDALRMQATDGVARAAAELGLVERGRADAAISGPKGNREVFLWLAAEGAP